MQRRYSTEFVISSSCSRLFWKLMFTVREEFFCGVMFSIVVERYLALRRVASSPLAVLSPFCSLQDLLVPIVRALEGLQLGC